VPVIPENCPPNAEETADLYCLGTLSASEAAAFEEHYVGCPRCAEAIAAADDYVRAMRTAAERLQGRQ
jgi:anti-sigma factor RsiW